MNEKVSIFLNNLDTWQSELRKLRTLILASGLTEDFKWKHPCYTYKNKNIVLLHGFKDYCAVLFYKGALLKDPNNILIQQTENTQSGRQLRFTHTDEIEIAANIIKAFILEAVEIEKSGLKVNMKKVSDFEFPTELQLAFEKNTEFETAFKQLTPGRQIGYLLHFSQAKQSKTRSIRIEKYTERIYAGKGLNDCVCGLSKRMPNCDGSHKQLNST